MLIRRALPGDGAGIARLIVRAAPHFEVKGYPDGEWPEGMVVLVAVDGDTVVGWIEGILDGAYTGPGAPVPPPHGYVLALVVDAEWRRRGVGTGLLDAFVAVAGRSGTRWVFLKPEEGEHVEERVAFFEQAGFAPVPDPDGTWPPMGRRTRGAG
ncbi:GNAT family N-acetyltransferase [Nocardiopsis sp. NPDC006198]|uniref:GNAT family N-acetyltransferase n=1 Tax=Streptomonospora nanhaiensis TaxID=1323731 RepID=A0ABY6YVE5_9ACTN|nr:GNAT family N-acetyltransferase [Streptomonospora nanhaiensis]WAE76071.1 GNAT family N-acetyltransferase [Streptomonospora nanhaiensis]